MLTVATCELIEINPSAPANVQCERYGCSTSHRISDIALFCGGCSSIPDSPNEVGQRAALGGRSVQVIKEVSRSSKALNIESRKVEMKKDLLVDLSGLESAKKMCLWEGAETGGTMHTQITHVVVLPLHEYLLTSAVTLYPGTMFANTGMPDIMYRPSTLKKAKVGRSQKKNFLVLKLSHTTSTAYAQNLFPRAAGSEGKYHVRKFSEISDNSVISLNFRNYRKLSKINIIFLIFREFPHRACVSR